MNLPNSPDTIICGGGVVGAAVAYYLTKLRMRVLIIESHSIARGASGFAAGIISAPSPLAAGGHLDSLHSLSFRLHHHLASTLPNDTGIDYEFAGCPMLAVADSASEARALGASAGVVTDQSDSRSPSRWVDAAEVTEVCPWIDMPVSGGLLNKDSAVLEPRRFTEALVAGACRMGASMIQGRVTGVTSTAGHVTGIDLDGEMISGGSVVFASGPWIGDTSDWLGFDIPIYPLKGQILRLRLDGPCHQIGFANGEGDYFVPKPSGLVFAGTTEENVGFDDTTTYEARLRILAFVDRYVSNVTEAQIVEQTACLRPMSFDDIPLLGPVPGIEGVYVATGHGRSGMSLSTGSGQAMAELIANGRSESLDLAPFDPVRFIR